MVSVAGMITVSVQINFLYSSWHAPKKRLKTASGGQNKAKISGISINLLKVVEA